MDAVEQATLMLARAVRDRAEAAQAYEQAIRACVDAGMSNVKIAKVARISEAGVRLYRKRHGI